MNFILEKTNDEIFRGFPVLDHILSTEQFIKIFFPGKIFEITNISVFLIKFVENRAKEYRISRPRIF